MKERGWYPSAIASAADVDVRVIQNAVSHWRSTGHQQAFGPELARRIIQHETPTTGAISVLPSRRRLRALAVMGWSLQTLAAECDISRNTLAALRGDRKIFTSVSMHRSVEALYRELVARPGLSEETAKRARAKGWQGPAAWGDVDLISRRDGR